MKFNKIFKDDIEIINVSLLKKEKFSFSKYADGERFILQSQKITNIDNWTFNPLDDNVFFNMLMDSFKFKDDGYYIGISCPCCDKHSYDWFNKIKGSDDNNTTFANIFVNNNYTYFKEKLIPTFNTYKKIVLIANKDSNLKKLKNVLNYTDFFGIGSEAFKTDLNLIDELKFFININNIKDSLFLFCAGPLGNVLSHQLWSFNKDNTYLDIGSTLNTWTEKNIRDYQKNTELTNKICKF
jgi:hypothetical protein